MNSSLRSNKTCISQQLQYMGWVLKWTYYLKVCGPKVTSGVDTWSTDSSIGDILNLLNTSNINNRWPFTGKLGSTLGNCTKCAIKSFTLCLKKSFTVCKKNFTLSLIKSFTLCKKFHTLLLFTTDGYVNRPKAKKIILTGGIFTNPSMVQCWPKWNKYHISYPYTINNYCYR